MSRHRLCRIEKAAARMRLATCRLCYGHPVAVLLEEWEPDPEGPGYRRTGRQKLLNGGADGRLTEDYRCARCGAEAKRIILMGVAGVE